MRLIFAQRAWEDYAFWGEKHRKVALRINELIRDIRRDAYGGIGKPEPLRNDWTGWGSRRIDGEHRLVYKVDGDAILIAQCRYHY